MNGEEKDNSCWTSFRTGVYAFPKDYEAFERLATMWTTTLVSFPIIIVEYDSSRCADHVNNTIDRDTLQSERDSGGRIVIGNCKFGGDGVSLAG